MTGASLRSKFIACGLALALPAAALITACVVEHGTGSSSGSRGAEATGGPAGAGAAASLAAGRFNLGHYSCKVTTSSPEAQAAFDRGLTLAYGFSHEAAEAEFRKAAAADPHLAMAWWGVALVNGPHINFPMVPPDKAATAWEALGKARVLAAGAGPTESALIEALAKRYADPQPADRRPLDEAYAAAMRQVWQAHPQDADVATLFAEAMMDLRPWDLWKPDGTPQPGTEEIKATLERALVLDPSHPGANHLYVHVVEGSPHPETGLAAADRLVDLVPGSSHLVHMPSHIYARVGRWSDAAQANVRAMEADTAYRAAHPRAGLYAMYMAHNDHFFAYAAMMQGRSARAIEAARAMVAGVPADFIRDYAPIVDGYLPFIPEVLMRFGKWDEVLAEPAPPQEMPLATALWRFTRAVSLTALGKEAEASAERQVFLQAAAKVPKDATFGQNPASSLLSIATNLLDGERAAKRGDFDAAVKLLRAAVATEDGLRYDEPPDWIQPVRHTLGAVLLRAHRFAEAEAIYREDLARYPENGWSLFGLGRALRLEKKDSEAEPVEARFREIWAEADIQIGSTCLCQPGI
jgi:tetratricopeptide (TPR) repeat protein